ncbi:MAG: adenine deaminase [Hyphomicrobiales bacterium]|nr:adenine deaminase [Hyphomicrobiales bacterium]
MSAPLHDEAYLARAIDQSLGNTEADLVIKGGRVFNLITGALETRDIAVCGDRIVGVESGYRGARAIEAVGKIVVPGFIDTHCHIESSLLTPAEFDRCVLPHGVTTAIWDPHEIANVLGSEGLRYALAAAAETVMDIRVQLSSCVPATELETSGARLEIEDLNEFVGHPKVIGLAELMNFPGVLAKDTRVLEKLAAFQGGHIDGHAPLLCGRPLDAYLATGVRTEHESTTSKEALEKLAKGMTVLIREGSVSKDLHALLPILTERHSPYLAFCTDDRNPLDIAEEGHLDFMIRTAIEHGASPLAAYRAASLSGARAFRLFDRGLVAPGYRADLVLLEDLDRCAVHSVISAGRPVDASSFETRPKIAPVGRQSIKAERVSSDDFTAPGTTTTALVIGVTPGKIITQRLTFTLPMREGLRQVDVSQDAVKVAVVARHGINRNIGVGFVHGFGLERGALASSVGHDSHNICVVGADEADMAVAVNRLKEIEGGFAVVLAGKVLAELSLPLAGLMSLARFEEVRAALVPLRQAAKSLGCVLPEPFLQVAFLPLPVIPHLKITDKGVVDVDRFEILRE